MKAEYPDSPAVSHNLGACLEARGDFVAAHGMYAEAAEQSAAISGTGQPDEPFRKALTKRALDTIERLAKPDRGWQPVPGGEGLPGGELPEGELDGAPADDEAGS